MRYIAIDLGGTYTKAAVMTENAEILEQWKLKSEKSDWNAFLRMMDECVLPHKDGLCGVAVCMPGMINPKDGIVTAVGSFPIFDNTPLQQILQERYGVKVSIANDGKSAAAAECWQGTMRGVSNGLVYVIGTAIGGGIILNGDVIIGPHFLAGELSKCLIDLDASGFSRENTTSHRGGAYAMLKAYAAKAGLETVPDGVHFFKKLAGGEAEAQAVFSDFCRFTASFFLTLQMALDMERIAIGGGISAEPILIDTIREEFNALYDEMDKASRLALPRPEIVRCRFGNDANLIGALKYLLDGSGGK